MLYSLLEKDQVIAPRVFDNISVRTVELCGFSATVLSADDMACSMCGFPDGRLLNQEEIIWFTNRMTDYTPLPVIVDADGGCSADPLNIYVFVSRLAKSGAAAVVVDDMSDGATLSRDQFASKIKAAVKACESTECLVIARTKTLKNEGIEEAISRCVKARELGSTLTMIDDLQDIGQAKAFNAKDPGWKVWADYTADAPFEADELDRLGFRIVVIRYTEEAAMNGMLHFGFHVIRDQNTAFHDTHDFDGILKPGQDYHTLFAFWNKWLPMEEKFNDLSAVLEKPHDTTWNE